MAPRPVRRFPDPILKRKADPVTAFDDALRKEIDDLIETMHVAPATIGLAAPQAGISKCIFVCDVSSKDPSRKLEIFVNPEIVAHSGERRGREGCLSLPNYTGNVTRSESVTIRAFDAYGKPFKATSEGVEAVCWQHEMDHLNGLLFIHRVTNLKTDVFRRKRYR